MTKNRNTLARNFSQALFSQEKDSLKRKKYALEIGAIGHAFEESRDLQQFLSCPSTPFKEKLHTLKIAKISPILIHFIGLVVDFRALDTLPQIIRDYQYRVANAANDIEGTIHLSEKGDMDQKMIKQLEQTLKKIVRKDVTLKVQEDKDIKGGFTLEVGDMYLDATLEKTLNNLVNTG